MDQLVPAGFISDVWSSVLECYLPYVFGLFADTGEWYSNPGKAGFKEMGASGSISRVQAKHSCADTVHMVNIYCKLDTEVEELW